MGNNKILQHQPRNAQRAKWNQKGSRAGSSSERRPASSLESSQRVQVKTKQQSPMSHIYVTKRSGSQSKEKVIGRIWELIQNINPFLCQCCLNTTSSLFKEIKSALLILSDKKTERQFETKQTAPQTSTTQKEKDKDWIKIVEDAQRSHIELMKELNSFDKEDLEPDHIVTMQLQDFTDL